MAVPAWVDRLRDGSFTSPSGIVSDFKVDIISRIGGKKASNHEILNTDESIPQDQGNRATAYPLEIYFTGENGDQDSDVFYDSLRERYTIQSPGLLKHPRWGDINVMPFEFQQVEQLVTGAGVFRVPVEFREIPGASFPTPDGVDQSQIIADITELQVTIEEANADIDIDDAGDAATFEAKINQIVAAVDAALSETVSAVEEAQEEFQLIQDDIDAALDAGEDAVVIMSQVVNLIRLPAQIADATLTKIQGYAQMITAIATGFLNDFTENINVQEKLNNARVAESILFFSVAASAEAGLFTDYTTRDAAGDALDFINDSFVLVEQALSVLNQDLSGDIVISFQPNHNTLLETTLLVGETNAVLIERSFSLKTKQTVILSGPSDPISLTWRFYKDISQLQFFIDTNNLQDNEIIELPAGKEVISYV